MTTALDSQEACTSDRAKALLRSFNEAVRLVEETRLRAKSLEELSAVSAQIKRQRLRDLACAVMFTTGEENCGGTARRAEDILWNKVFHDVIVAARALKTPGDFWKEEEALLLQPLLFAGISFFKNILNKLETDYDLDLKYRMDFSLMSRKFGLPKGKSVKTKGKNLQWAAELAQRCLIYQGDLYRYLLEFKPKGWDAQLAERCYYQALGLNYKSGRPFNQLGTLAGDQNFGLDRVYYYLRSMNCEEPFALAEVNLKRIFEKNADNVKEPMRPLQRLISNVLLLMQNFEAKTTNLEQVQLLCLEICEGFQKCLSEEPCPVVWDMGQTDIDKLAPFRRIQNTDHLDYQGILKIFGLIFMYIDKLKYEDASSIALALSLLDHMATYLSGKLKKFFESHPRKPKITVKFESNAAEELNPIRRRHRRRRKSQSDESDSEAEDNGSSTDEEFANGNEGEEDKQTAESIEEEGMGVRDVKVDVFLDWLSAENLLRTFLVGLDWLKGRLDLLDGCKESSKVFLENVLAVINLVWIEDENFDDDCWKIPQKRRKLLREKSEMFPTPEDVFLRGVPGLQKFHDLLNWNLPSIYYLNDYELTLIRLYRIYNFGKLLTDSKLFVISFDKKFHIAELTNGSTEKIVDEEEKKRNGELMKNMGQLWLKAEVQELESRVRHTKGHNGWSPYLIVDPEALIQHMHLIKKLVGSRQFIVIIPVVVLGQLDESKRSSGRARETIRWLESQFQHGNRNLRAQKHQETFSLPLVRYPKRKDKEAWNFFKMMECCYYFNKQTDFSNAGNKPKAVTFLTGIEDNNNLPGDFSRLGIAKTFGINMEFIMAFYSKWKTSSKSNG